MKLEEIILLVNDDPRFEGLPQDRKEALQSAWVGFVTARIEQDKPDWGTVVTLLLSALPDEDARIFANALEKISG